jgi:hypothetical protein
VPEEHDGALIGVLGAVYGYTLGLAGVTAGNTITWLFERPLRLFLAIALAGVLTLIIALTW